MKKIFISSIFYLAALSPNMSFAQKQKPNLILPQVEVQHPRETKSEKRDELSKRLMQRKNELRKEEHGRERRNSEAREKSNNSK